MKDNKNHLLLEQINDWTDADSILETLGLNESKMITESESVQLDESFEVFAAMALGSGIRNWTMEKLARISKQAALTSCAIWCKKLNITTGFRAIKREGVWEIDFRRDLYIQKDRGFFKRLAAAFFMKSAFGGIKPSIPFKIGVISGNMFISDMNVRTMFNFPREVRGDLDVSSNSLSSLAKFPMKVSGKADLSYNKIGTGKNPMKMTDDKNRPIQIIYGSFDLSSNQIKNFNEFPVRTINGDFNISQNPNLVTFNPTDLKYIGGSMDATFLDSINSIRNFPEEVGEDVDFTTRGQLEKGEDDKEQESSSKIAMYFVKTPEDKAVTDNPFTKTSIGGDLILTGVVANPSSLKDSIKEIANRVITTDTSHKISKTSDSGIDQEKLTKEGFESNFKRLVGTNAKVSSVNDNISNIRRLVVNSDLTKRTDGDSWKQATIFQLEHNTPKDNLSTLSFKHSYQIDESVPWTSLLVTFPPEKKVFLVVSPIIDKKTYIFNAPEKVLSDGTVNVMTFEDDEEINKFFSLCKSATKYWSFLSMNGLINTKSSSNKTNKETHDKKPKFDTSDYKKNVKDTNAARKIANTNQTTSKQTQTTDIRNTKPTPKIPVTNVKYKPGMEPTKTESSTLHDWLDYILD